MSIQQTSPEWDDSIDLRKWIDALLQYKWLILGSVVLAVAAATIFGYVIQTPTFESSGGASLPSADGSGGLGLTLRGYQEFASSTPVMDSVSRKLGLEPNAGQLRSRYSFQLNRDERFITVTASAETGEEAFQLASWWIEAYDEQVQVQVQEQFSALKDEATNRVELLTPELTLAEDELARFYLENPIHLLEARFSALEAEISSSEARQRKITRSLIPAQEDRLASLTSGPSVKLGAFGGGGSPEEDGNPAPSSLGSKEQTVSTLTNLAFINLNNLMTRARLTGLEEELVQSATRLRDLTWSSIPIEEERLRALENAIEAEPRVLGVTQSQSGGVPANPSGKENFSPEVVINPVYVKLAQDLAETRVRLATSRREAITLAESIPILENEVENHREELVISQEQEERLNEKLAVSTEVEQLIEDLAASQKEAGTLAGGIPSLREEVRELREELAEAKATRGDLDSEVTSLRTAHEPAMAELDRLLEIEPRLATIASLSTIREPAVPTSLVAPQRNRNILLAAVLGIMLGGFGALFLGYYRTVPPVARANEE